ncbi:hypothetical protein PV327_011231, partial [Microctonus hyperodae]
MFFRLRSSDESQLCRTFCSVEFAVAATTPKDRSPTLSPLNAFSRAIDTSAMSRSVEQLSSPMDSEPRRSKQPPFANVPTAHSRSSATRGGPWGSIS